MNDYHHDAILERSLFHVAPAGFPIGTILQPGRFGRSVRAFRPGSPNPGPGTHAVLLWEMALETVRREVMPEAPSRLDSLFACEVVEAARSFRDNFRRGHAIYRIEPVEGACIFRGNYSIITNQPYDKPYLDYMPEVASRYWTGQPDEFVEVLIGGAARIVEVLEV